MGDHPRALAVDSPFTLMAWVLLAVAWFATMAWRPLLEPDEGRYAEIPREMQANGDWVTPRLNGFKYFEKPPLQYWATAAAYSVFGVSEGSSRLWSCLLAFLCLPLVFCFARSVYGTPVAGVAAVLALAVNPYFAIVGQLNLLDSALTFFLCAAVFAFLQAPRATPRAERGWMVIAAAALALATLSKGIVALVLAGGTVVIHLIVTRQPRPLRAWHLPLTVPVYLALAVPWFLAVSRRNPEFPEFFFLHEHFARYLTDVSDRVQPFWYFLPILLIALLPWLGPAVRTFRGLRHLNTRDPAHSITWFLVIWCALTVVFFSVSHSKLAPYILPIMPALAVLLAPKIAEQFQKIRGAAWVCGVLILLCAMALIGLAVHKSGSAPVSLITWASVAAALAVLGVATVRVNWLVPAVTTVLGFQLLMVSYAALPPLRTAEPLANAARRFLRPDTQLFSVGQYRQSLAPYLERTLRLALYRGELDFGINQEPHRFISTLDAFKAEWLEARAAIAFVDPVLMEALRAQGVPHRELVRDGRTVVILRR